MELQTLMPWCPHEPSGISDRFYEDDVDLSKRGRLCTRRAPRKNMKMQSACCGDPPENKEINKKIAQK
jgi:hypothetical protein